MAAASHVRFRNDGDFESTGDEELREYIAIYVEKNWSTPVADQRPGEFRVVLFNRYCWVSEALVIVVSAEELARPYRRET